MTACDATLVTVLKDGGVYTASLALSPLIAALVRRCGAHSLAAVSCRCCLCLNSGCSSVDGNTHGREGGRTGGEQGSANWDRRSGS